MIPEKLGLTINQPQKHILRINSKAWFITHVVGPVPFKYHSE